MKEKVLVTGGTGYIGSHTAVELQKEGFEVFIADDLSNSEERTLESIESVTGKKVGFRQVDLKNREALKELFEQVRPGSIIHFAAVKSVGESTQRPLLYYENNLLGLINLLRFMAEYGSRNLIYSSSCTVYGQPEKLPVTEKSPIKPALSPYGNTKQVGEEIIRDTSRVYPGLNFVSLRYFNPVGAHPSGTMGEFPQDRPNNLMPYILKVASGEIDHLKIFGNDYPTPDGTCIRDYIHVVDLAQAHVKALQRQLSGSQKRNLETFNIGTGSGYSVQEMVDTFQEVTSVKVGRKYAERRPGDVAAIYADARLAERELGWKAQRNLPDMIRTAWKWHQHYLGRKG